MKLKKILITGIVTLSSLLCMVVPIMANEPAQAGYYCPEGTTYNVYLKGANIKLANVEKEYAVPYNHPGSPFYVYTMKFLVRNCTYDKNIVVHSKMFEDEDRWEDSQSARYVRTLSDMGTADPSDDVELWEVILVHQADTPFCVWYKEVDSWDNNNYANYTF